MDAAPAAIPPKPKIAATIAITRKIKVQRNISKGFLLMNKFPQLMIKELYHFAFWSVEVFAATAGLFLRKYFP